MIEFDKKVLFVGYGAVAQCALPILLKLLKVPPKNVTVMDFEDRRETLKPWIDELGPKLNRYLKSIGRNQINSPIATDH